MKLMQEETPVAELQLAPHVRQRLEALLSTYAELQEQIDLLQSQADIEKSKIGKLLADHGYDKAVSDDFYLNWIRGAKNPKKLDRMKLLANGVSQAQIDAALVGGGTKTDYFQIRPKNAQGHGPDVDE